ncbi:PadR family transcriptional regulator [Caldalkalibacillus mannanilyticus]|uniref:PadR family transcriptional regulator n=1 Tax=Caldalkalibacillus mannanilyticus TaxID=1418 RepID=UPI000469A07F|nr:PadR family transcriptional regulator [Caldalkalibacillus mannanilyticus]
MSEREAIIQNIQQEMKRGTLVLAVLTQMDQPQYGYSLIQALNKQGLMVEQNTLYPLLRRIEKQGLLESIWQVEGNRPRRYYKISELGIQVRNELINEWKNFEKTMSNLIGGEND